MCKARNLREGEIFLLCVWLTVSGSWDDTHVPPVCVTCFSLPDGFWVVRQTRPEVTEPHWPLFCATPWPWVHTSVPLNTWCLGKQFHKPEKGCWEGHGQDSALMESRPIEEPSWDLSESKWRSPLFCKSFHKLVYVAFKSGLLVTPKGELLF